MFLCLPELRRKNKLLEKLHPVPESGGHWRIVIKEGFLPMFGVTTIQDAGNGTIESTWMVADAFELWVTTKALSQSQITGIDCYIRSTESPSWKPKQVMEVWTVRGHEMLVAYLKFREEPDALFDAYTLQPANVLEDDHLVPLLVIDPDTSKLGWTTH